jgi:ATP-dependent helicase/nuclease subunit B
MPGAPTRRVLFHPDPERLETELAAHIRAVKTESGPWARVLVTVPTQRQAERLRERLAGQERALLGVEVLQYQALAYRLLESSATAPSIISEPVLERLIESLLSQHPQFALAAYARERPGVLAELRARLEELREAGIAPADFASSRHPASVQTLLFSDLDPAENKDRGSYELSVLLNAYELALDALESRGWTDRPGLARRAARNTAHEFEAVFAYGAYEIVGAHLELLHALSTRRPVTFFVPADLNAPAWQHARDQATRFFRGVPEAIGDDASGARDFVAIARCLYDPEPAPLPHAPRISLANTQGPEAELTLVARRALALINQGVPPHEIAVVARSLEPYTALAESVFARHRLPVDASGSLPLARHPEARAVLLFLRAFRDDFDRRTVAELVRSPHLIHPQWARDTELWRPSAWDRWSRTHGLTRGVEAWTVELPRLLRERSVPPWLVEANDIAQFRDRCQGEAHSAELLGRLITEWAAVGETWRGCARADEHASMLDTLRRRWIRSLPAATGSPETAALERTWNGALEQIQALEAVQAPASLDRDTVLDFMCRVLETAPFALKSDRGMSFLDLRQARGLTFRHVFFIGMNDGLYPRPPRETPLLPDRVRVAIRDRSAKPLAVRREGRAEERLLFAQLVASTRDALVVSWQRADAEGRALAPSLALRELAAILPGKPALATLLDQETAVGLPTEPTRAAAWLEEETGLLLREEAALLSARKAATAVSGVSAFLEKIDPQLGRELSGGLALIEATESGADLRFDGAIDLPSPWSRPYSALTLEQIARCPLTFFFQNILKVRPLEQEAREYRTEAREIGQVVHGILENVYRDLAQSGHLKGDTEAVALQAAGRAALDAHWDEGLAALAWRMNRRYPLLYATTARIWKHELEAFLDKDLARLAEGGHILESLETAWNARLRLGDGTELAVTGVPDRVTRDRDGRFWISDYKTAGKPDKHMKPIDYLRAEHVQLPLYVLMGMSRQGSPAPLPEAEIVGLGPNFYPDFGFVGGGPHRFEVERFALLEAGFLDTLSVLGDLVRAGRFPFRTERHCRWCQFHVACRRHQLSSETRVLEHPDHRRYFSLEEKIEKNSMLPGKDEAP